MERQFEAAFLNKNLTILSIFRDRQFVFPRYFQQIENLEWPFGDVHVIAVENDSKDKTREILNGWNYRKGQFHLMGDPTSEKYYGSMVHPERFRILSNAVNIGLDAIVRFIDTEYVMFIENDIIYKPNLAISLKKLVDETNGIVAPMVWTQRDLLFYDIWAFRYEHQGKIGNFSPNHKSWYEKNWSEEYKQILSAGTCLMFKKEVICKGARLTHEEAIVGLCKTADVPTYAAYRIHIFHPQ